MLNEMHLKLDILWQHYIIILHKIKQAERLKSRERRAKVDRLNGQWLIGLMVDRSNSERLRGFCDRQTDRWTFAILKSLS